MLLLQCTGELLPDVMLHCCSHSARTQQQCAEPMLRSCGRRTYDVAHITRNIPQPLWFYILPACVYVSSAAPLVIHPVYSL